MPEQFDSWMGHQVSRQVMEDIGADQLEYLEQVVLEELVNASGGARQIEPGEVQLLAQILEVQPMRVMSTVSEIRDLFVSRY